MSELARVEAEFHGTRCVVRLFGEVDISNAKAIAQTIEASVPNDATELAVDLTDTRYLDSSGVSLLVRLAERLKMRRQHLRLLVPADSPVRAILELTGLPSVMTVELALDG